MIWRTELFYHRCNFNSDYFFLDVRNAVILFVIHSLIKPTARICSTNKTTKKRSYVKPTIVDSRQSFFLLASTSCELQSKIKITTDLAFEKKETLQPLICCVGEDVMQIKEYFIYYGSVFYKFENILKCFDVAFKIFHVLNLEYPVNCKNVYLFFQECIYNIALKNCEKTTILSSVLNDIKNTPI